jgi:hypothetical protein
MVEILKRPAEMPANPFQIVPWDVLKTIYKVEMDWLAENRWNVRADFLEALFQNKFSLMRLQEIRKSMAN